MTCSPIPATPTNLQSVTNILQSYINGLPNTSGIKVPSLPPGTGNIIWQWQSVMHNNEKNIIFPGNIVIPNPPVVPTVNTIDLKIIIFNAVWTL